MSWFVYILASFSTGRLYTGISTEPERRLREHNGGPRGAKYTRSGRPWKIVRLEEVPSRSAALKREHAIKKMNRAAKLALAGLAAPLEVTENLFVDLPHDLGVHDVPHGDV